MDAMGGAGGYAGEEGGFLDGNTQSAGKKKFDKSILPVTVKQLQMAQEGTGDTVEVDGMTAGYHKLVGTIESVEEHTTVITYMINDTTGTIKCMFYVERDDGAAGGMQKYANCRQDSFVRVVGLCRSPGADLNVLIYSMQPVTDFNEVTHHMLDTIYCHNISVKGALPGVGGSAVKSAAAYNMGMGNLAPRAPMTPGLQQAQGGVSSKEIRDAIVDAIRKTAVGDHGTTKQAVINYISAAGLGFNMQDVAKTLTLMHEDGAVYGTIDEDHFMSTE